MTSHPQILCSREQQLALKVLATVPETEDALYLLPVYRHECIRLASLLPPFPKFPANATLRRDVPYLPPRWIYGYVYSPQQAIEAAETRGDGNRKLASIEVYRNLGCPEDSVIEYREIVAESMMRDAILEIIGPDYAVTFEAGWENGEEVQLLALGDTWELPMRPTDDQLDEIGRLMFGDATRRPMWYVDRKRCLWKPYEW
ncbi:hypothetical protein ONZ45_g5894 [Pleurotus djamor]|nr:hypothetical protein ONZ45_g5894 [Pleurotus djamor]